MVTDPTLKDCDAEVAVDRILLVKQIVAAAEKFSTGHRAPDDGAWVGLP